MSAWWSDPDVCAVLLLGFAFPLLGLLALLGRPRRRWWWAAVALGSAAWAVGAVLTGQPRGLWLPLIALAGLCAVFQLLGSEYGARAAAALFALLRRPMFQAALLVAAGPALAAGWVVWNMPDMVSWQPPPTTLLIQVKPQFQPDPSPGATTDAGRPLPLYHSADPAAPADQLMDADMQVIATKGLSGSLIRTAPPSQDYNCHGWVFTGGRGWIEGTEVEQILQDNAYYPVTDPGAGDLAIYRDSTGAVTHSGLVRGAWAGAVPVIESKWGEGGRFLSAADTTPYGPPTYYRTLRSGHLLRGLGEEYTGGAPAVLE